MNEYELVFRIRVRFAAISYAEAIVRRQKLVSYLDKFVGFAKRKLGLSIHYEVDKPKQVGTKTLPGFEGDLKLRREQT